MLGALKSNTSAKSPPLLLVASEYDSRVAPDNSVDFMRFGKQVQAHCEFFLARDATHNDWDEDPTALRKISSFLSEIVEGM